MDKSINEIIVNKIENILKEINEKISLIDIGLENKEAMNFFNKVINELNSLLPKDSIQYRKYASLKEIKFGTTIYSKIEKTIFVTENSYYYNRLFNLQDFIKELLKMFDPEALDEYLSKQNNYYYSQGNFYEAKRMVIKIMKSAKNSIVIIDPYLDDTIFDYIDLIEVEIDIKLVTSQVKKLFKELFNNLKNIRKNIDVKQSEGFHDRFIIIDEKEIWGLGASINHIGKNAFHIDKITDKEVFDKVIKDYNLWWQNGKYLN